MEGSDLEKFVTNSQPSSSPPVTLIIGSVGAGKSTYLKHFELVKGRKVIEEKKCHWIYIDFEKMGKKGNPRTFIYQELKNYLLAEHPYNPTDYRTIIEPAYDEEIKGLARGPFALIFTDKAKFNSKISELIEKDYENVEPYVDKIFKYLTTKSLCVIVLDNIDLYEDDELETEVFSEGIALSKKIKCHIMASIRDTTFVKHKNDSIFNAFELKKLWLDPPPFKAVLSKRLAYAKRILNHKKAIVEINNFKLNIPNLALFFDIVQESLLEGVGGNLIEAVSGRDVRKGLNLVSNFLTSGHIRADKAIKIYLYKKELKPFPYYEVFYGAMLGQWKYYKEERSEAFNIYDSRFGSYNLLLLRLYIVKFLIHNAKDSKTAETSVTDIIEQFSKIGASENHICLCLNELYKNGLIRSISSEMITKDSIVIITITGGYYITMLSVDFVYIEAVMFDTSIFDANGWDVIRSLTKDIENESSILGRLELRQKRAIVFTKYLKSIEEMVLNSTTGFTKLKHLDLCIASVTEQSDTFVKRFSKDVFPKKNY